MDKLLMLLEEDARYTPKELSAMLGISEDEVKSLMAQYEKKGVISGYKAIIDWEKTDNEYVYARIEIKVTPEKDRGFEEVAEQIAQFDEVQSVYLMSGGYDLGLTMKGDSFKTIASFVATRLAPMDSVQSTATHFVLKKYKEKGIILSGKEKDERRMMF